MLLIQQWIQNTNSKRGGVASRNGITEIRFENLGEVSDGES